MVKVLFVCLGNICRSPMAQGIFQKMIHERKLDGKIVCDSCGIENYHVGKPPDERALNTLFWNSVDLEHKARKITAGDLKTFDFVLIMDEVVEEYVNDLYSRTPDAKSKLMMMRSFDPDVKSKVIPDPYYGAQDGFVKTFELLTRCCVGLMEYILTESHL